MTGARGADRGRMREAYTGLTNADAMTSLSIQDLCLPFLADLEKIHGKPELDLRKARSSLKLLWQ